MARDPADEAGAESRARLWQHRLHEDLLFNERHNFFLVAESLLVVAYSELYDRTAPAAIVAGAGLLLALVWVYVAARMRAIGLAVHARSCEQLPDFAETWRLRPRWLTSRAWPSSGFVFAYVVPVLLAVLWIVLGVAALLSW
jgi:hypothetical protein